MARKKKKRGGYGSYPPAPPSTPLKAMPPAPPSAASSSARSYGKPISKVGGYSVINARGSSTPSAKSSTSSSATASKKPASSTASSGSGKAKAPAKPKKPPEKPTYNPQAVSYGGSASAVFMILFILFIIVSWKDLVSKLIRAIWDPKAGEDVSKLPWDKWAGAIVFIFAATLLASTSDEMSGFMLLVAIAIALVYLIENRGGGLTEFLDMLSKNAQK